MQVVVFLTVLMEDSDIVIVYPTVVGSLPVDGGRSSLVLCDDTDELMDIPLIF
jgi:hypothetical protein